MKVLGYGPEDDEELMLTSIDLNIKPIPHCNDKYTVGRSTKYFWEIEDALPNKFNGGSIFCASNVGTEAGTCRGDSGGPTLFNDGIKYHQLGVVHGSITSCDGSRFPGIFVRIDNPEVFDWLSKVTSSGLVKGRIFDLICEILIIDDFELLCGVSFFLMEQSQGSKKINWVNLILIIL